MTTWNTDAVIGFVRKAGFTGIPLNQATAIALATSDGDDAYYVTTDAPGHGPWVGLFGIEDNSTQNPKGVKLLDPVANARLAYNLWRSNGKSWDWSPQYVSGEWKGKLAGVRATLLLPASPQSVSTLGNTGTAEIAKASIRSVTADATATAASVLDAISTLQ